MGFPEPEWPWCTRYREYRLDWKNRRSTPFSEALPAGRWERSFPAQALLSATGEKQERAAPELFEAGRPHSWFPCRSTTHRSSGREWQPLRLRNPLPTKGRSRPGAPAQGQPRKGRQLLHVWFYPKLPERPAARNCRSSGRQWQHPARNVPESAEAAAGARYERGYIRR